MEEKLDEQKQVSLSVRVESSVKQKIEDWSKDKTKGVLMAEMVALYEQQHAEEDYPGRADDIRGFNNSLSALKGYFQHALEHAATVRNLTLQESSADRDALQKTITGLQANVDEKDVVIAERDKQIASLQDELDRMRTKVSDLNSAIHQRDGMIDTLQKALNALNIMNNVTDTPADPDSKDTVNEPDVIIDKNGVMAEQASIFEES